MDKLEYLHIYPSSSIPGPKPMSEDLKLIQAPRPRHAHIPYLNRISGSFWANFHTLHLFGFKDLSLVAVWEV